MDGVALLGELDVLRSGSTWQRFATENPADAAAVVSWVTAFASGAQPTIPTLKTATGKGIVGMLAATAAAGPAPPPPPPPPPPPNAIPFRGGDLSAFINLRKPGDHVICLAGGTITVPITKAGTATAPIVVDGGGQVFSGRWDYRGASGFIEVHHFGHMDAAPRASGHQQSGAFGGHDIWLHDYHFSNAHTKIGYEVINNSTYGQGRNIRFERFRHDAIGQIFASKAAAVAAGFPSPQQRKDGKWVSNNDHGFYDVGTGTQYVDGMIIDCADRALQLRGPHSAHAQYVTWANCGEGLIFGDIGAVACLVEHFIGVDRQVPSRCLIEEYDPAGNDSGNRVQTGWAWNRDGGIAVGATHSVTYQNLQRTDPQLGPDFMPVAGSPAVGNGCRVLPPTYF